MRIGIVGSREFSDLEQVRAFVRRLEAGSVVVSGGARGVDRVAEEEARAAGLEARIFEADWQLGKMAGALRNEQLVKACDRVIVFWDGKSAGSKNVIDLCKRYAVRYEVRRDAEVQEQLGLW